MHPNLHRLSLLALLMCLAPPLRANPFERADELVRQSVATGGVPGAVLLIGHQGQIVLRRAYGLASLRPQPRAMTPETIFDLASLSKPVATSTAAMLLLSENRLALDDVVSKYLPVFAARPETQNITLRHLLAHTAGFRAGGAYAGKTRTLAQIAEEIAASPRKSEAGTAFLYSDFSFITLGAVIEAASGQRLDDFCRARIFEPLGLRDTFFRRNEAALTPQVLERIAPTTSADDTPEIRGLVHDPTARALGGVAGHAGLFSTADDLARFCLFVLDEGELHGKRLLPAPIVAQWIANQAPALPGERALGWDLASPYSIRGALGAASFGHTGFTGTSIWIEPASRSFIILLTNAVHARPAASVIALRRALSNAVAEEINRAPTIMAPTPVQTGLQVLVAENFKRLEGRRVGVVCNHSATDAEGRHLVDLLAANPKIQIVALFGPEHGIRGDVDAGISDSIDAKTGLKVFSLYDTKLPIEQRYRPSPEMLQGIDTLIFDVQDAGVRYYTYSSTLGYVLEAAAQHKIKVVVLDRPNPIGGNLVEGPLLDPSLASFVGYHTMPISHGMTLGELARLFNEERKIGAELEIVSMRGWKRSMLFDQTGLPWTNPSPNLRSARQAWLYAGVGFLEFLPLSVGRGTDTPFEIIGAPWLDALSVAADLNARGLPGVTFVPTRFTPTSSKYKGEPCGGVQILLWDRSVSRPAEMGIHILHSLLKHHADRLGPEVLDTTRRLIGSDSVKKMLLRGESPQAIIESWRAGIQEWKARREKFLLYS